MSRDGVPAATIDVTPLQTAHRHRGIGAYVHGLLHGLDLIGAGVTRWGFRDVFIRFGSTPAVGPRRLDPRHGASLGLLDRTGETNVSEIFHVTNPDVRATGRGPLIVTAYDLVPSRWPDEYLRDSAVRQRHTCHLEMLQRADVVIAISDATRREVTELLDIVDSRIVVARPGVPPLTAGNHRIALNDYYVVVGTPEPHKNVGFAIDVVGSLPRARRHPLLATGRDDRRWGDLRRRAEQRGVDFRFLGHLGRHRLGSLYARADAVLVPSRYEGFGLPAIEALSVGAWVVSSDQGALPEAVGDAGEVLPLDLETWRKALIVGPPPEDVLAQGPRRAGTFQWSITAEATVRAYQQAMS